MTDIHIPPAALEAAARQICGYERDQDVEWREYIGHARAAFLAMIDEWPRMYRTDSTLFSPALILPLTEASDDKT